MVRITGVVGKLLNIEDQNLRDEKARELMIGDGQKYEKMRDVVNVVIDAEGHAASGELDQAQLGMVYEEARNKLGEISRSNEVGGATRRR